MFKFKGFGWLAPVVFLVVAYLARHLSILFFGQQVIKDLDLRVAAGVLFVAGIAVTIVGLYLDKMMRPVIYHPKTGIPMKTPPHTFLSIDVKYWGIILFAVTMFFLADGKYDLLAPLHV